MNEGKHKSLPFTENYVDWIMRDVPRQKSVGAAKGFLKDIPVHER